MKTHVVDQPDRRPTRKMQFTALGGAVAAVVMGIMAVYSPEEYARIPPGFEAGIATLFAFAFGYYARDRMNT